MVFLRRTRQAPDNITQRIAGVPGSGTAVATDDQPNLPSFAPPWVEKDQVAGVSAKFGLERIPVDETNRKLLFLSRIVEDNSLNEKLLPPVMVHSGLIGAAVEKSQDGLKETDWPPGTLRNDPESAFFRKNSRTSPRSQPQGCWLRSRSNPEA